jgi:hypothetical protein
LRRIQERGAARDPALFGAQIRERDLAELAAVACLVPVDLHVVRAGDQRELVLAAAALGLSAER